MVTSTITVVQCHPVPESFTIAVAERVRAVVESTGHSPNVLNLYDDVDLVTADATAVDEHRRLLSDTSTLIIIYPTWWSAQPALLQAWFDRVWARADTTPHHFASIRQIIVCTTHGSPKWLNGLEGESGKRTVSRYLRRRCAPRCRVAWVALYGMDTVDATGRQRHLDAVDRRLRRLLSR